VTSGELTPGEQPYSPEDFWGADVWAEGYAAVPRRLLFNAANLGLKPAHQALLLQLLSFKMTEQDPFPSNETLAERLGVSISTVQRLRRYVEKKLGLTRAGRRRGTSNQYDLSPLATTVSKLPPVRSSVTRGASQNRPEGGSHPRPSTLVRTDHLTRTTEQQEPEEKQPNNVLASLKREGVKGSVALGLIADYGTEQCLQQLQWLPYRKARDPAAVLVESIKRGWGPPSEWLKG
jgi:hypothetical protein